MIKHRYQAQKYLWLLVTLMLLLGGCNTTAQSETKEVATKGVVKDKTPMVLVPAGYFTMGDIKLPDLDLSATYTIWLDAYYIDTYEVTNSAYKKCVTAGACLPPPEKPELDRFSRDKYYDDPAYDIYPVINIDWNAAKAFCEWRDARLPTQAEWVKAARGTDLRVYPWGDEEPTCQLANYGLLEGVCSPSPYLAPVGSRPEGVSPYGVYDLVGNVQEWTADCYGDLGDFMSDKAKNPIAPESSSCKRVILGASILEISLVSLKIDIRDSRDPEFNSFATGFRCVRYP